jgi:hypothetical protein
MAETSEKENTPIAASTSAELKKLKNKPLALKNK